MKPFRSRRRRERDALRAVDGLLESQLQSEELEGGPLARLAATMAIELSSAERGALFLDEGEGLVPVLVLRSDFQAEPTGLSELDREIVRQTARSARPVARGVHIAAPVLLAGRVTGVLYLTGATSGFGARTEHLAAAVANRIASLLRSTELVNRVARQRKDLETLESLSADLGSGNLSTRPFDQAVEAAAGATNSAWGLLGFVDPGGELAELRTHGETPQPLPAAARRLAEHLMREETLASDPELLPREVLFEPLSIDLVAPDPSGSTRRPVGFLAVGRPDGPAYGSDDSTFFSAVAHLLSGAIARLDYFQQAAEDPVTETGSRLALQLNLAEAHSRAQRTGQSYSVVLTDIDEFKEVNDRHGHLVGDKVLREVADTLRERLRGSDFVARYGGDEFVLIFPDTPVREAEQLAEELRSRIGRRKFSEPLLELSVSMGVASSSPRTQDAIDVLQQADRALYQSKAAGRNRVTVFSGRRAGD